MSDAGSPLGWVGDGFGDGLAEGEVGMGEGLGVWRAVGLGAGEADVVRLGSEPGPFLGATTSGFPPPSHAVAIKPSTLTAMINRFIGRSLRLPNREASVGLRRNRPSPSP